MITKEEAKALVKDYEEKARIEEQKAVKDYCEKKIAPQINEKAMSGGYTISEWVPIGLNICEVIKYLESFGYNITHIDRMIDLHW